MNLARLAVSRTRATLTLAVLLVIWGTWSWAVIPVQADPEVQIPYISVTTPIPGVSPQDVERLVTRPLEEKILEVENIKGARSYSFLSSSVVVAEFPAEFQQEKALQDIRQAVEDTKPELPADAEESVVKEFSSQDFPLMRIAVVGENLSMRPLLAAARRLRDELERLQPVLQVDMQGDADEVVEIVVDRTRIESYQLRMAEIYQAVVNSNSFVPAGYQDTGLGSFDIKVPSVLDDAADLLALPIKTQGERVVRLGDVADVRATFRDPTTYSAVNSVEAITLLIVKRGDANDIDTARQVRGVLEAAEPFLPSGVRVEVVDDSSEWARDMVSELEGNIGTAIFLVMLLVVASLGLRAGLQVGLSIPFCFVIAFGVLHALDLAFNFMVMFGLLLSIGMLIDGAIVVVEYASRFQAQGFSRRDSYLRASSAMFWPITASAATTAAAFIPLILWPGVTGQFMRYLPITVFTVLAAALLYSLVITPVIGTLLGRVDERHRGSGDEMAAVRALLENRSPYARLLRACCANPLYVLGLVLLSMALVVTLYTRFGPGSSYFVDLEPNYASVEVKTRGNLSLNEKVQLAREVGRRISDLPEIRTLYLGIGSSTGVGFGPGGGGGTETIASFFAEFRTEDERARHGNEVIEEIRARTEDMAGLKVLVEAEQGGPPAGEAFEVEVLGANREQVWQAARDLRAWVEQNTTATDVRDTLPLPNIEWRIDIDRERAGVLGASVQEVGTMVQMATSGLKVDEYLPDGSDEEVDILVRLPTSQRTLDQFDQLYLTTAMGLVPFSSFIDVLPVVGHGELRRMDGNVAVNITAAMDDEKVGPAVARMEEWARQNLPDGVQMRRDGRSLEQQEVVGFLSIAMVVALLVMLIMLVTEFDSFYQSFLTLSAVAMSVVGVLLMMLLTDRVMSVVMDGMGLVTLAGVVVNNNIVLIDTFNRLSREHGHLGVRQIAVMTGIMRLRPVILTTATTVFGLLPMVFGLSVDLFSREISTGTRASGYWENLATTVASGLTCATVLTLVVTPVALTLPDYLRRHTRLRFGGQRSAGSSVPMAGVAQEA